MSLPTEGLQRRHYIDNIRRTYNKWVNWDPKTPIRIGTYGQFDDDTGLFVPEGNIYDPEFQKEFDRHDIKLCMANYPPEIGPTESDVIVVPHDIKEEELKPDEKEVPGITDALIKLKWKFNEGKTSGIFAMHQPHQIFLPPRLVLEHLYWVDRLIGKYLVTVVHVTDAYTFYLSDKSGGTFSLALLPEAPSENAVENAKGTEKIEAKGGVTWWADAPTGLLRQASDPTGECSFMPIYGMRRPIKRIRRFFRDRIRPEPEGDELWFNDSIPWDPLDEDGNIDPIDPEVLAVDPFWLVEQEHRKTCDGCPKCKPITVFD